MPISESKKFQRMSNQQERKDKAETNKLEKKARVEEFRAEKRAAAEHRRSLKRMADIGLFKDDFVERTRRDTTNQTIDYYGDYDKDNLDWDYYEYYYGADDDYEVEVGDYENEFDELYPDYVAPPGFSNGIQARGRRGKKRGKGKKLGPHRSFFNITQALKTFIGAELKTCARKDIYQRRLSKLVNNIKQNSPVLLKPPPKKGKKGKKGKRKSSRAERRQNRGKNRG